jgi:hypothetical protein
VAVDIAHLCELPTSRESEGVGEKKAESRANLAKQQRMGQQASSR